MTMDYDLTARGTAPDFELYEKVLKPLTALTDPFADSNDGPALAM